MVAAPPTIGLFNGLPPSDPSNAAAAEGEDAAVPGEQPVAGVDAGGLGRVDGRGAVTAEAYTSPPLVVGSGMDRP